MLKSQHIHSERLSTEMFSDARAAKIIYEVKDRYGSPETILGHIQEIVQDPFGLILLTILQVTIFFCQHTKKKVIYFFYVKDKNVG